KQTTSVRIRNYDYDAVFATISDEDILAALEADQDSSMTCQTTVELEDITYQKTIELQDTVSQTSIELQDEDNEDDIFEDDLQRPLTQVVVPATQRYSSSFVPATPTQASSSSFVPATPTQRYSSSFVPATPTQASSSSFVPATQSSSSSYPSDFMADWTPPVRTARLDATSGNM
ncbi:hypothetical protein BGX24_005987, partial [Mortierella sp. AD032]